MTHEQNTPLRQLPVDLSEIEEIAGEREEAYLDDSYATFGYVDTQSGQVHAVFRAAFRCAEGEMEAEELASWARDHLEVAAAILEDNTGRYQEIDRWESSEDYKLMERFAECSQNPRLREQLFEALNGRKPFRRFGDALAGWPEAREAWFAYRDHAHRDWIRTWLNSLGIEPVDTSACQPKPVPEKW